MIDIVERNVVKFFVSDMWKPYAELSEIYFKESIYLVDKYHYIRKIIWVFEKTRKRVQKKYSKHLKVLKRTGYGYRNFNRFRKRILHIFSYRSQNNNEKEVA